MSLRIPPALHHRGFLLLWLGMMLSVAGTQMQFAAMLWHIRDLTNQPIFLSGVGLARFLPILLFSLVGGVVADVFNRRVVVFIAQVAMVLSSLGLAYLTTIGQITYWHMYALTAIQGTAVVFSTPARHAIVPNLVPSRDIPSAFGMTSIAMQIGSIIGPGISGLVIAYFGQEYTYLFSALSFSGIMLAIIFMGDVKQEIIPSQRRRVNIQAIREGVNFIINQPIILSTMILDFFATFFSSARTLLPIIARDILNLGVLEYGWLAAAESIGAVSAALVISQLKEIRRQGAIFLWSVVVFGLATIAFGLATGFWMAMLTLILIGASDSVSMIIRNTIRQLQTPDRLRGRMVSVNQIFFMGGPQLGEMEAGVVAQFFGAPAAVISGGIGCILAVALITRRWPQLRAYNGDEPLATGASAD
jgi:MFS family permease